MHRSSRPTGVCEGRFENRCQGSDWFETFRQHLEYCLSIKLSKDSWFRALADPTRRRILRLLGQKEMAAGELASHFEMTAPSMSHHFGVLKEADLISQRREGQQIIYTLNTTVAQDLLSAMWDLLGNSNEEGPKSGETIS